MLFSSCMAVNFFCTLLIGIHRELSTDTLFGPCQWWNATKRKPNKKKRMIIIGRESDNNSKNESVRTLTPLTQANTTVPWESRNGLWYNWPRSWMHSADCIWQAAVKSLVRKWTADVAFFSISRRSDFTSSQVHATCLDFLHWIKHGWHSLAPLDILGLCVSFEECPLHACMHVTL